MKRFFSTFKIAVISLLFAAMQFGLSQNSIGQINGSKGVPKYTNYIIGDNTPAGQQVWNVGQDNEGFIYTGTSTGLQKFDGVNWELLPSPVQDFLTNVRSTYLASDGTYYYGSISDFGVVETDSTGATKEVSIAHLIPEEIAFNDIWTIVEAQGEIYFQAREAIFIYSPNEPDPNKKIKIWKPDTAFMYGWEFEDNYLAHQAEMGLFRNNNGTLEFIEGSEIFNNDRVQVLLPYKNAGEFLVGAFAGGLYLYDGQSFLPFITEIDYLLQERSLYRGLALPNNTYALSVLGHGFFILDQEGKALNQFTTKNSIPDQSVYAFHLDNTQNLWVGTNAGLCKIELFSPLTQFNSDEYEVGNILSLNAYGDDLYMGGSTSILYIDSEDGEIKKVQNLPNTQVFAMAEDGNQLVSTGPGLYEIRGNSARLIPETQPFQTVTLQISKQHPGYIFTGGTFGLHVFKREQKANGDYQYESIGPITDVGRSIYSIQEDADGEIWAGTQAGYLYRVQIPKTASGNLKIEDAVTTTFSDETSVEGVSGVVTAIDGKIYTSGVEGYFFFDKESDSFKRDEVFSFSDKKADLNLDTYGIGLGTMGNVFLSFGGENRLAIPQEDGSYVIREYPLNLITANITGGTYTEKDGTFWFATDEGLLRVDATKEYKTDHPLPLYFNRVESSEGNLVLPKYFGDQVPSLVYKGNNILFNYIAPFFIKENQIQYRTFLDGLDEEWSDWDSRTSREFSNLPYGSYIFRVKARNAFNLESEEIAYSFEILPPWYATWWAFVLYFILFGLIVYGLVKFQTGRILAREKEKNREKELAQAREIEKAYEGLKATQAQLIQSEKMASLGELTAGIAHEIQNPLNFVKNFSELNQELIEELREEIEKGNLDQVKELVANIQENEVKIVQHCKRADSIVKGMLQHSRSSSGEKHATNLNVLAEEYLKLSYHGLRAKDKSFSADFKAALDPDLPKVQVVRQDIGRVLLNLINNAFYAVNEKAKSGIEGYKPEVNVSTKKTERGIEISVKDNGNGIPESIKEKIFQPFFTTKPTGSGTGLGLSLSYDIVKAHGGELKVESQPGSTVFTITIHS
ncbi:HAMP domain-containing histidine kinase [Algoriphagus kandeliae]|uniref:histidine kinase n=1 Tax=Algoriphagus kandeliae TaxID=2562278 RepID=A0A4Y9QLR1_9BACT|nr:HAMP domain-containing sensor histidine kinase [Algoriphagus kandeliae]TFV93644.1 HAMP domain-containing histidine kinase [Algoriphagus kandeliae]